MTCSSWEDGFCMCVFCFVFCCYCLFCFVSFCLLWGDCCCCFLKYIIFMWCLMFCIDWAQSTNYLTNWCFAVSVLQLKEFPTGTVKLYCIVLYLLAVFLLSLPHGGDVCDFWQVCLGDKKLWSSAFYPCRAEQEKRIVQLDIIVHQKTTEFVVALLREILDCLDSAFDFVVGLG